MSTTINPVCVTTLFCHSQKTDQSATHSGIPGASKEQLHCCLLKAKKASLTFHTAINIVPVFPVNMILCHMAMLRVRNEWWLSDHVGYSWTHPYSSFRLMHAHSFVLFITWHSPQKETQGGTFYAFARMVTCAECLVKPKTLVGICCSFQHSTAQHRDTHPSAYAQRFPTCRVIAFGIASAKISSYFHEALFPLVVLLAPDMIKNTLNTRDVYKVLHCCVAM